MPRYALRIFAWSACSLWLVGCGGGSPPAIAPDAATRQVRMVGALYGQFLSDHAGAVPANEAQFVASLERNSGGWKKLAATPQALLTSPRDGQPLVIAYGAALKNSPAGGFPWVAHEQTGVEGRLLIVDARGNTQLKNQQEVDELFTK